MGKVLVPKKELKLCQVSKQDGKVLVPKKRTKTFSVFETRWKKF